MDRILVRNIDVGNGRVLDFQGSNRVTYLNIPSVGDCLTACMGISGGQNARIERPLVMFQNPNGNYPISVIPDNIDGKTCPSSQ